MADQTPSTALSPAANAAVQQVREQGALATALRQEENRLFKTLEGMEWGSGTQAVKGSSLSPATRFALAQFCLAARANPMYHLDILGGKPYLNAQYWSDRLNSEERYVDHRHINISDDPERRKTYGVPEWALAAYVCVIRKLLPFAPIAKLRSGEILDFERYVVEVEEPNWAGNKPKKRKRDGGEYDADPIGNEEATKTARTRALRRTAARAFPVWMQAEAERIEKLEKEIQGEWRVIRADQKAQAAALPPEDGPQALLVGAGEPQAAPREIEADGGDVVRSVAAAKQRFQSECEMAGVDDVDTFIYDALGRDPITAEDYDHLSCRLDEMVHGEPE